MSRKNRPHVDAIWEEAKAGRRLSAGDRRRVMVYLEELGGPDGNQSAVQLAKIFQVSEHIIRLDRKTILRALGQELTPEAQVMIVARHMSEIDSLIVTARNGMRQHTSGALGERWYVDVLLKLYKEKRETYENIGVIRKELGTLNVAEECWVATVDPDNGNLGVHQAAADELAKLDDDNDH